MAAHLKLRGSWWLLCSLSARAGVPGISAAEVAAGSTRSDARLRVVAEIKEGSVGRKVGRRASRVPTEPPDRSENCKAKPSVGVTRVVIVVRIRLVLSICVGNWRLANVWMYQSNFDCTGQHKMRYACKCFCDGPH